MPLHRFVFPVGYTHIVKEKHVYSKNNVCKARRAIRLTALRSVIYWPVAVETCDGALRLHSSIAALPTFRALYYLHFTIITSYLNAAILVQFKVRCNYLPISYIFFVIFTHR